MLVMFGRVRASSLRGKHVLATKAMSGVNLEFRKVSPHMSLQDAPKFTCSQKNDVFRREKFRVNVFRQR